MASYTTNLNLKKPAGSENVAIGDINNNMDLIDSAYGTLNSKLLNFHLEELTVPANGSTTIPLATTTGKRGLATNFSSSVGRMGLWDLYITGSYGVVKEFSSSDALTFTGSSSGVTVANSTSNAQMLMIMWLS